MTTVKIGQQPCCDQRFAQRLNTKHHQPLGNNIWCQSDCIGGSTPDKQSQSDAEGLQSLSNSLVCKFANNCHWVYKWRQISIILQSIGLQCVSLQLEVDFSSCHLVVFCTCHFTVKLPSCRNYVTICGGTSEYLFFNLWGSGWTMNVSTSCEFACMSTAVFIDLSVYCHILTKM